MPSGYKDKGILKNEFVIIAQLLCNKHRLQKQIPSSLSWKKTTISFEIEHTELSKITELWVF